MKYFKVLRPINTVVTACKIFAYTVALVVSFTPTRAQINADRVVDIGRNALYFDDYVVAIQYFNQAIATKPYRAKPYFYRAIAKLYLEDFRGAEEDATKAIELNEYITDAWEVRGVARQNMGNNKEAVGDYEHALALTPRNRGLMLNLGVALTNTENYEKADSIFGKLIDYYPGYENGYLGRARVYLATSDTLKALEDIDTALVRNPNSFNGHVMRAELLMNRNTPLLHSALADMDMAIKLEPKIAGLYINRAFIRYGLDDWDGAMSDYDNALSLDPLNSTALFNRGMLNAEAGANDKAQEDFTAVLTLDPDDVRAHYNRALIRTYKRDFEGAIQDIDAVINTFPNFPAGYFLRSDILRQQGKMTLASKDYDKAMALTKKLNPVNGRVEDGLPEQNDDKQLTEKEFARLLTVEDNSDLRQQYGGSAVRGNIQDKSQLPRPEPMVELSYYSSPTELNDNTYFIKELDDINRTRQLRFVVLATINPPQLRDESAIARHFNSVDYYNSYLGTHTPRAIDYIGRAMDFITLRDYAAAIRDLDRAIALNPDFAPAYMMRAQSRMRLYNAGSALDTAPENEPGSIAIDGMTRASLDRKNREDILSDIDTAIRLVPSNPYLHYNKGVILTTFGESDPVAIDCFNQAIELKPDFGPAYYNRGFVELRSGYRNEGLNDLSRAGQLGVVSAYNLMKKMKQ